MINAEIDESEESDDGEDGWAEDEQAAARLQRSDVKTTIFYRAALTIHVA
jgi:hypothetical protein